MIPLKGETKLDKDAGTKPKDLDNVKKVFDAYAEQIKSLFSGVTKTIEGIQKEVEDLKADKGEEGLKANKKKRQNPFEEKEKSGKERQPQQQSTGSSKYFERKKLLQQHRALLDNLDCCF